MKPLATYNSLTDKHLTGYFNNTRIRRHLQRAGLVTRNGRIVSEKEYRLNIVRKDHQKYVRECLAQAIFHKVLDMERHHQLEIKKRLEDLARRERIQRIKVERARRSDDDIVPFLSPRPPTGPRIGHRSLSGPDVEQSDSSTSPSSPRPSTAPGKMQRPVRLLPLQNNGTATVITARSSPHLRHKEQQLDLAEEIDPQYHHGLDRDSIRNWHTIDFPTGMSPYRLPVINNYVTPVPPPPRKREKNVTTRSRRLQPATAPNGLANLSAKSHRAAGHISVLITMVYRGKRLHLSYDQAEARDEVKVHQQHCGGENLCVYKGKLLEAEKFQFVSRRHPGFPFSLTFFLNGIQIDRLSSCCEYKHRKGSRLGGKHAYFSFLGVDGASPCYRCIIAMGLDKKPTPPPKRMKEEPEKDTEKEKLESAKGEEGPTVWKVPALAGEETCQEGGMSAETSTQEDKANGEEKMDEDKEERAPEADTQGGKSKEEYDDDFEDEEEKPGEEADQEDEGREGSPEEATLPPENERLSSDDEKPSAKSRVREEGRSASEEDSSSSSDGESESEDKPEGRRSRASLRSSSYSPSSREESDGERAEEKVAEEEQSRSTAEEQVGPTNGAVEGEVQVDTKGDGHQLKAPNGGKGEGGTVSEEGTFAEGAEGVVEQTVEAPAGEDRSVMTTGDEEKPGTKEEIEDGEKVNGSTETADEEGAETRGGPLISVEVHVIKSEDAQLRGSERDVCAAELSESGRCVEEYKSVQDKIADAIRGDRGCDSEPEPSDSSTEEEEEEIASDTEKGSAQNPENEVPSATQDAGEMSTDAELLVGELTAPLSNGCVNSRELTATLGLKGLTGQRTDPVEDSTTGGGPAKIRVSGGTASSSLNEEQDDKESSEELPSTTRNAKGPDSENKKVLLDSPARIEQEMEEEERGGERRLHEEKGIEIKGENTSDGEERKAGGVGETEASRSEGRELATRVRTAQTGKSEERSDIAGNVEVWGAPENEMQMVSAVSSVVSVVQLLSLEVFGAGPDAEETKYVGKEEDGTVQSGDTSSVDSILHVRERAKEEPNVDQEESVIKNQPEATRVNLGQPISSPSDSPTEHEGEGETLASFVPTGTELEIQEVRTAGNLLNAVPKASEQETPPIDQIGTPRTESGDTVEASVSESKSRATPDAVNETRKGTGSEELKAAAALELKDADVGKVQAAPNGKPAERKSTARTDEDPRGTPKNGLLLQEPPRLDIESEVNVPMGKGLGSTPTGSCQEASRGDPEVTISDPGQIPSKVEDGVSTVDAVEERLEDKEAEVEFEVKVEATDKENSKSENMEMESSDGDIGPMQPGPQIEESRAGLEVPVLCALSQALMGQAVISPDAAPEAGPEVQIEEAEMDGETEEEFAAPATESEGPKAKKTEASSEGIAGAVDLRSPRVGAEEGEETNAETEGDSQLRVQKTAAAFVRYLAVHALIEGEKTQTGSGEQNVPELEAKEDSEALTDEGETRSFAGTEQKDEGGAKLQEEEAVSEDEPETHPLKDTIDPQGLNGGDQMDTETQVSKVGAKQENGTGESEAPLGRLTPEARILSEGVGVESDEDQGFSGMEPEVSSKDSAAERHRVEESEAEETECPPPAEEIETDVGSAKPPAETKVKGIGERLVTQRVEVLVHTQYGESIETQDGESIETQDGESIETQDGESIETQDGESIETQDGESIETQDGEPVVETQDGESVETQDGESVETQDGESVETQDRESVETQDRESVVETQDRESVETLDVESVETQDGESVETQDEESVETQDRESVVETRDRESVVETQDRESVETRDRESIETQDGESVETLDMESVETQDRESIETQDGESVVETRDRESVETLDMESVETRDRESVAETRDRELVAETRDRESIETRDRETVVETRDRESVAETRDRESIETRDRESVAETRDRESIETRDRETVVETRDRESAETRDRESAETRDRESDVETQDGESMVETQDRESDVETQDGELVVETRDRESVVETQDRESDVETRDRESVVETRDRESVVETRDRESVVETRDRESVVETRDRESVVEIRDRESVVETRDRESVVETRDRESVVETRDRESVVETRDRESVVETRDRASVAETQDRESVVETRDRESVETRDRESVMETQDRESDVETQDGESVVETRDRESVEAWDRESVVETQDREMMVETRDRESVAETQDKESVSETREREMIVEAQDGETVAETQARETVAETQDRESAAETKGQVPRLETWDREGEAETRDREGEAETRDREGEAETGDREGEAETQDKGGEAETQDRKPGSETQDREGVAETQDREGVAETQDREGVAETQDKEGVAETQDKEGEAETQDKEGEAETQDKGGEAETQDRKPGSETQDREGVAETQDREGVAETQDREGVAETQDKEGVAETQDKEGEAETQDKEGEAETQDKGGEAETQDRKPGSETQDKEGVAETQDKEGMAETQDKEGVAETQDKEGEAETQDREPGSETQDKEGVAETQDKEGVAETQDKEGEAETQDKEREAETQDREPGSETQDKEGVAETQDKEGVAETQDKEGVAETQDKESGSETQDKKPGSETQDKESGSETQDKKPGSETQDKEGEVETQDKKPGSETQDKEGEVETQDREAVTEAQNSHAGEDTKSQEAVEEIRDREAEGEREVERRRGEEVTRGDCASETRSRVHIPTQRTVGRWNGQNVEPIIPEDPVDPLPPEAATAQSANPEYGLVEATDPGAAATKPVRPSSDRREDTKATFVDPSRGTASSTEIKPEAEGSSDPDLVIRLTPAAQDGEGPSVEGEANAGQPPARLRTRPNHNLP
ncbi:glutamate-rich protein 3 [Heptranchias perlo]|uniref:glutamate-rich protein 3 n=1 Tax=Heptranchias perlo TaxID=212740 RepID=UPI0035596F43